MLQLLKKSSRIHGEHTVTSNCASNPLHSNGEFIKQERGKNEARKGGTFLHSIGFARMYLIPVGANGWFRIRQKADLSQSSL